MNRYPVAPFVSLSANAAKPAAAMAFARRLPCAP